MVSAPLREPAATGVKVTVIVQVLPFVPLGGSGLCEMQASVSEKSPLAVMLAIERLLVPVFVSITFCVALEVFTTALPKFKLLGLRLTPGSVPVPLRLITCVPAPSTMVIEPVCPPAAVGVKVTVMLHVPLAASGLWLAQLSVSPKSLSLVTLLIVRLLVPLLVSVTLCDTLVVPTTWLPKARVVAVRF